MGKQSLEKPKVEVGHESNRSQSCLDDWSSSSDGEVDCSQHLQSYLHWLSSLSPPSLRQSLKDREASRASKIAVSGSVWSQTTVVPNAVPILQELLKSEAPATSLTSQLLQPP